MLGAAVSDVAEMALREIAATVFSLKKAERQNRTFADQTNVGYDKSERTGADENERSEQNGADLQDRGGLSHSQSHSAGGPEGREVWDAAADLPPAAPERDLHRDAAQRQAERTLGGHRPAGRRDDGPAGDADGPGAGSNRGTQGSEPDEMGGADEQHPGVSGGDRDEGTGSGVTPVFPTEEEQISLITEAEAEKASAFVISQEDIDAVLLRGSGVSGGKFRIFEQFQEQESTTQNVKVTQRNAKENIECYNKIINKQMNMSMLIDKLSQTQTKKRSFSTKMEDCI